MWLCIFHFFFISSLLCGELLFIVLNGHGGKIIVRTYMGSMRHKYIVVYMILLLTHRYFLLKWKSWLGDQILWSAGEMSVGLLLFDWCIFWPIECPNIAFLHNCRKLEPNLSMGKVESGLFWLIVISLVNMTTYKVGKLGWCLE